MKRHLDFIFGVPLVFILGLFKSKQAKRPIKKVLVIKLAAAGDTILLANVLQVFKLENPDVDIHWLVSNINVALAKATPGINKVICWSGKIGTDLLQVMNEIRPESYDAVIDLEQWSRGTALIAFFSGAPTRWGFKTLGQHRDALYTDVKEKRFDRHEIDEFRELLSIIKPLPSLSTLQLWETELGKQEADNLFSLASAKSKLKILIHPGCGSDGLPREWPIGDYAILAHWLLHQYKAQIYLSGGREETIKAIQLNNLISNSAVNVAGLLSWLGMVSFIKKMDVVISGNTGVMHMAAALGKKQIALHGPTDPKIWGPINPQAAIIATSCPSCPCLKLGFEYHTLDQSCMKLISLDAVKRAFVELSTR